ncbi:hypothetical protein EDB80DRAFT_675862 [Ilyonectria destructans]|nr:hypothetical protein EDB80DRAFT_675862 [Ilyonectria destructans]
MLYCSNNGMNWIDFKSMLCDEIDADEFEDMDQFNGRDDRGSALKALPLVMGRHVDKHSEILQPLYDVLVDHHSSKCKDPRDRVFSLMGLIPADERCALGIVFPDYNISEDHVLIITLSHLMRFQAGARSCLEPITTESTELFLGLGVESVVERQRLIRRARNFDYLVFDSSTEILVVLGIHDEMEQLQGLALDDIEPDRTSLTERQARRMKKRFIDGLLFVLIVAAYCSYRLITLDRQWFSL